MTRRDSGEKQTGAPQKAFVSAPIPLSMASPYETNELREIANTLIRVGVSFWR
jgi:hypothetical protein